MNNELIVLEQLPIIRATLENLSVEIKEKVDRANNLIVNEDTVKEVKQVRADLNKEFNEWESQRKAVKQAIMAKYDEFEEIYKENVSNLYKNADSQLKEKIDNVENQLKQDKIDELEMFANQYFDFKDIADFVTFEDIGLNVTLSASMKSLKDQIVAFVEKISSDIQLIEMEEYKDEILVEYKNSLDFAKAKMAVVERHKQLDELKQKQEQQAEIKKEEEQVIKKVESALFKLNDETGKYELVTAPKEIIEDEDLITCTFTVTGTKEQVKQIKNLIVELGVKYE